MDNTRRVTYGCGGLLLFLVVIVVLAIWQPWNRPANTNPDGFQVTPPAVTTYYSKVEAEEYCEDNGQILDPEISVKWPALLANFRCIEDPEKENSVVKDVVGNTVPEGMDPCPETAKGAPLMTSSYNKTMSSSVCTYGTSNDTDKKPAASTGQNVVGNCPTREEANDMIFGTNPDGSHRDIFVQVPTEACTYQINTANPTWFYDANIPEGVWATAHLPNKDQAELYRGPVDLDVWRLTVRFPNGGFPEDDAVHDETGCSLLEKEIQNGLNQVWQFGVVAGNIDCPDLPQTNVSNNLRENRTAEKPTDCPTFGGIATTAGSDGAQYCKYKGKIMTDKVPTGWKADYWNGTAVQYADAGESITTGEATFRPAQ